MFFKIIPRNMTNIIRMDTSSIWVHLFVFGFKEGIIKPFHEYLAGIYIL